MSRIGGGDNWQADLKQFAVMAYGNGFNEGTKGGTGFVGLLGDRLVKTFTHSWGKLGASVDTLEKSSHEYKAMVAASDAARTALLQAVSRAVASRFADRAQQNAVLADIRRELGLSVDDGAAPADTPLLSRKILAKVVTLAGGEGIWNQEVKDAAKAATTDQIDTRGGIVLKSEVLVRELLADGLPNKVNEFKTRFSNVPSEAPSEAELGAFRNRTDALFADLATRLMRMALAANPPPSENAAMNSVRDKLTLVAETLQDRKLATYSGDEERLSRDLEDQILSQDRLAWRGEALNLLERLIKADPDTLSRATTEGNGFGNDNPLDVLKGLLSESELQERQGRVTEAKQTLQSQATAIRNDSILPFCAKVENLAHALELNCTDSVWHGEWRPDVADLRNQYGDPESPQFHDALACVGPSGKTRLSTEMSSLDNEVRGTLERLLVREGEIQRLALTNQLGDRYGIGTLDQDGPLHTVLQSARDHITILYTNAARDLLAAAKDPEKVNSVFDRLRQDCGRIRNVLIAASEEWLELNCKVLEEELGKAEDNLRRDLPPNLTEKQRSKQCRELVLFGCSLCDKEAAHRKEAFKTMAFETLKFPLAKDSEEALREFRNRVSTLNQNFRTELQKELAKKVSGMVDNADGKSPSKSASGAKSPSKSHQNEGMREAFGFGKKLVRQTGFADDGALHRPTFGQLRSRVESLRNVDKDILISLSDEVAPEKVEELKRFCSTYLGWELPVDDSGRVTDAKLLAVVTFCHDYYNPDNDPGDEKGLLPALKIPWKFGSPEEGFPTRGQLDKVSASSDLRKEVIRELAAHLLDEVKVQQFETKTKTLETRTKTLAAFPSFVGWRSAVSGGRGAYRNAHADPLLHLAVREVLSRHEPMAVMPGKGHALPSRDVLKEQVMSLRHDWLTFCLRTQTSSKRTDILNAVYDESVQLLSLTRSCESSSEWESAVRDCQSRLWQKVFRNTTIRTVGAALVSEQAVKNELFVLKHPKLFSRSFRAEIIERHWAGLLVQADSSDTFAMTAKRSHKEALAAICHDLLGESAGFTQAEVQRLGVSAAYHLLMRDLHGEFDLPDGTRDVGRIRQALELGEVGTHLTSVEMVHVFGAFKAAQEEAAKTQGKPTGINSKPILEAAEIRKAREGEPSGRERDVHQLAAEILYGEDIGAFESSLSEAGLDTGSRLRQVFKDHADLLADLMRDRLTHPDGKGSRLSSLSEEMQDLMGRILDDLNKRWKKENSFHYPTDGAEELVKCTLVGLDKTSGREVSDGDTRYFAGLEALIDTESVKFGARLQERVNKMLGDVFPAPGVQGEEKPLEDKTLREVLSSGAEDGQMQLVKNTLKVYFKQMNRTDLRAMLAAEAKNSLGSARQGVRFGALLKGAGPIMQKMLQGLNPDRFKDEDFKLALADMKDNLAPIPQKLVDSILYDLKARSHGEITSIKATEVIGAASVGEAVACTVTMKGGETKECVAKILRPDARMRAMRETSIFRDQAKGIPGMERTFRGQLHAIMAELDLTVEQLNVQKGLEVYGNLADPQYDGFDDVHTMQLLPGCAPTKNALLIERVPGTNMKKYMDGVGAKADRIAADATLSSAQKQEELRKLHGDVLRKHKALTHLTYMWINEGLFGKNGFYHGDVHMGNIMVDTDDAPDASKPYGGCTLIDYGNVTKLTPDEQNQVVKLVAYIASKNPDKFIEAFRNLLALGRKDAAAEFDRALDEGLREKIHLIASKGGFGDTGLRFAALFKVIQSEHGIEIPAAIHNFQTSQERLTGAIDTSLAMLDKLDDLHKKAGGESLKTGEAPKTMMDDIVDVVSKNAQTAMQRVGGKMEALRVQAQISAMQKLENVQNSGWYKSIAARMSANANS